jgi:hypothetical protein
MRKTELKKVQVARLGYYNQIFTGYIKETFNHTSISVYFDKQTCENLVIAYPHFFTSLERDFYLVGDDLYALFNKLSWLEIHSKKATK